MTFYFNQCFIYLLILVRGQFNYLIVKLVLTDSRCSCSLCSNGRKGVAATSSAVWPWNKQTELVNKPV